MHDLFVCASDITFSTRMNIGNDIVSTKLTLYVYFYCCCSCVVVIVSVVCLFLFFNYFSNLYLAYHLPISSE